MGRVDLRLQSPKGAPRENQCIQCGVTAALPRAPRGEPREHPELRILSLCPFPGPRVSPPLPSPRWTLPAPNFGTQDHEGGDGVGLDLGYLPKVGRKAGAEFQPWSHRDCAS